MAFRRLTQRQVTKLARITAFTRRREWFKQVVKELRAPGGVIQRMIDRASVTMGMPSDMTENVITIAGQYSVPPDFTDEERQSAYGYPSEYQSGLRDLSRQIDCIRAQPECSGINPDRIWKLAKEYQDREVTNGAEKWFVSLDPTFFGAEYHQSVGVMLEIFSRLVEKRLCHYLGEKLASVCLRQTAHTIDMESRIRAMQGSELWIEMGQFGKLHAGQSVRRVQALFPSRFGEYGGGLFKALTWLWTHDGRLKSFDNLWIDCPGDEFSPDADGVFEEVPLVGIYGRDIWLGVRSYANARTDCGSISAFVPLNELK